MRGDDALGCGARSGFCHRSYEGEEQNAASRRHSSFSDFGEAPFACEAKRVEVNLSRTNAAVKTFEGTENPSEKVTYFIPLSLFSDYSSIYAIRRVVNSNT